MKIADVALSIPYFEPLQYLVPNVWWGKLERGDFVLVPLKRKKVVGMVVKLAEQKLGPSFQLKTILAGCALPFRYPEEKLAFLEWAAQYYFSSLGEFLEAAIPASLWPEEKDWGPIKKKPREDALLYLASRPWVTKALNPSLKKKPSFSAADYPLLPAEPKAFFWQAVAGKKAQGQAFQALEKHDLEFDWQQPPQATPVLQPSSLDLSQQQSEVLSLLQTSLAEALDEKTVKPFLLHGVTGSGKTELYIRLAKQVLAAGKSVLILVPEIGLTPQTYERFQQQIPNLIYQVHSGLEPKKRAEKWLYSLESKAWLIIGTRSAIFAPLPKIKLVIVDEEHDQSFRQQEKPFYNARDLAVKLGQSNKALVVLGSATPSVESFYNAKTEKYAYAAMPARLPNQSLPKIQILDQRVQKKAQGVFYLSEKAKEAIEVCLAKNQQVLIFLNRRGYASMLVCNACEQPQFCPNCSLPLTWHSAKALFLCHICNYATARIETCQHCHETAMHYEGLGTQRIEKDFQALFPSKRILRIDRDAVKSASDLEKSIRAVKQQEVDLIIGTQIITKGHDFAHIGLVFLPAADLSLNLQDFRASERTFQQIAQVSGRGGRSLFLESRTLIQTYNPEHPVFKALQENDAESFYSYEINKRQALGDAPFSKMALVALNDESEPKMQQASLAVYKALAARARNFAVEVLKPVAGRVYRTKRRYQQEIWLKSDSSKNLHQLLQAVFWNGKARKLVQGVRLLIQIDP